MFLVLETYSLGSVCFGESFVIFISFVHYPESTSLFTLFINKIYDMSVHCHTIFFPKIPLDTKILFSLLVQCNAHCSYLDIYISRKIRLRVVDFVGKFQNIGWQKLKCLECYTFYLLTRPYFRLVLSYHYCNFGEVFSLDVV